MKRLFYTFITLTILINACDKDMDLPDNPLDPNNPGYVAPSIEFVLGPGEGETVNSDTIIFSWRGNIANFSYRYKLQNTVWSDFSKDSVLTLSFLEEGEQVISAQAKFDSNGDTSKVLSRSFIMDAVKGPALMFNKRRISVARNEIFLLYLFAEEMDSMMLAKLRVEFDKDYFMLTAIPKVEVSGDFLTTDLGGGDILDFVMRKDSSNTTGLISVDIARAGADLAELSGSGEMVLLNIQALKIGQSTLKYLGETEVRNAENKAIKLKRLVEVIVDVK